MTDKVDERKLRELVRGAVTAEDWTAIIAAAVERAKDGESHARSWLTEHLGDGLLDGLAGWPENMTDEERAAAEASVDEMLADAPLT